MNKLAWWLEVVANALAGGAFLLTVQGNTYYGAAITNALLALFVYWNARDLRAKETVQHHAPAIKPTKPESELDAMVRELKRYRDSTHGPNARLSDTLDTL